MVPPVCIGVPIVGAPGTPGCIALEILELAGTAPPALFPVIIHLITNNPSASTNKYELLVAPTMLEKL